jgi:hypothetical protein
MPAYPSVTFSDGPDVCLQLGNEEFLGTLSFGSAWTHIRIGLLWQITGTSNIVAGNLFSLGMCSGNANGFASATTTNWIGVRQLPTVGSVYYATPQPYYYWSDAIFASKKVGSTITNDTSGTSICDNTYQCVPATAGTARRGLIALDITKGSPNYTVGMSATYNVSSAGTDFTVSNLLAAMLPAFGSIVGCSVGNGAKTIAFDETAGVLDTVNFYSNMAANPVNISTIAVQKLA